MKRAKKKKVQAAEPGPVIELNIGDTKNEEKIIDAALSQPLVVVPASSAPPDGLQQELDAALVEVHEFGLAEQFTLKEMRNAEKKYDVASLKNDAALARLERQCKAKDRKQRPSSSDIYEIMLKEHEKLSAARISCLETQLTHCQVDRAVWEAKVAARDVRIRMLQRDIRRLKKSQLRRPRVRAEE